jgi:hypothetical protein
MKRTLYFAPVLAIVAVIVLRAGAAREKEKPMSKGNIAHMVYFKLKDNSEAIRQKLIDSIKKHLDKHEGTVYFSAGVIGDDFKRDVNDREWDIGLHLVFKDKAAHDKYQDHPRHNQFVEDNKATWAKVRVFDAVIK